MVRRQARSPGHGPDGRAVVMSYAEIALSAAVLAPGAAFALLGLVWLLGWTPPERFVARLTAATYVLSLFGIVVAWLAAPVRIGFGNWFTVENYRFPLVLMADRLSLPFLALTAALAG